MIEKIKQKLESGRPTIGSWMQIPSASVAEIMGRAGYDWVAVDVISEYISVLKYRHWLAHGRYWVPKLGRNFDIMTVTTIADRVSENVPFLA